MAKIMGNPRLDQSRIEGAKNIRRMSIKKWSAFVTKSVSMDSSEFLPDQRNFTRILFLDLRTERSKFYSEICLNSMKRFRINVWGCYSERENTGYKQPLYLSLSCLSIIV